ncbi:hypothetical protein BZU93_27360 [Salmonella enterica subsp. enterica]|nr:hypothetical protein [Escherichia coli]MIL09581.1 hypothetical protein [Salmonella enterica subsp. enterica serovar Enteritidis]
MKSPLPGGVAAGQISKAVREEVHHSQCRHHIWEEEMANENDGNLVSRFCNAQNNGALRNVAFGCTATASC